MTYVQPQSAEPICFVIFFVLLIEASHISNSTRWYLRKTSVRLGISCSIFGRNMEDEMNGTVKEVPFTPTWLYEQYIYLNYETKG